MRPIRQDEGPAEAAAARWRSGRAPGTRDATAVEPPRATDCRPADTPTAEYRRTRAQAAKAVTDSLTDFNAFRGRMNDIILNAGNLTINRFFALDHRCYEPGALGTKTKEMLGLVSSLVLRCDDCITYHVVRCHEEGTTREEFLEIFSVGLVVGGSIVIPHLRRAMARLEDLAPG